MRGRRIYSLHPSKGFRLNSRQFGVVGLHKRVVNFIRSICGWKWKSPALCKRGPKLIKQGIQPSRSNNRKSFCSDCTTTNDLKARRISRTEANASKIGDSCRSSTSFDCSSDSFYSNAIADCLEFIKMSALSADDPKVSNCQ